MVVINIVNRQQNEANRDDDNQWQLRNGLIQIYFDDQLITSLRMAFRRTNGPQSTCQLNAKLQSCKVAELQSFKVT